MLSQISRPRISFGSCDICSQRRDGQDALIAELVSDDWWKAGYRGGPLCEFHLHVFTNLQNARSDVNKAFSLLQRAWNLDPSNEELGRIIAQLGVSPQKTWSALDSDWRCCPSIEPEPSRSYLDELADFERALRPSENKLQALQKLRLVAASKNLALVYAGERCVGVWFAHVTDTRGYIEPISTHAKIPPRETAARLEELGIARFHEDCRPMLDDPRRHPNCEYLQFESRLGSGYYYIQAAKHDLALRPLLTSPRHD